jgi:glutamate-1-semialdehyde 2,1-aminomutase
MSVMLANADLDASLVEAREQFTRRNPASLARHVEACAALPGGNTRTVLFHGPFPLSMARGEGAFLWDVDGHRYLDYLGEYTAGLFGHSHPAIRRAIDRALDQGINLGAHNTDEAKLAKALVGRFPSIELVRFTNSGTEANLMAISAALAFIKRRRVLVFDGGYHGAVFGFAGGGNPLNAPFSYLVATYNDVDGTRDLIRRHAAELGVIILEPMLGGGGCIPATRAFLEMLREEAMRASAILIFDEVMTSRLSSGGLQRATGVTPDMTTLGKYVGGGMSFGAFGGRADIMGQFDPRRPDALPHAGTFNNNVLSMAAGVAAMTEIYTPDVADAHNARGDALRERLNGLIERHGAPMQVTGLGTMMTVHFTRRAIACPADAKTGDERLKELFFLDLVAGGIWLARRGMMTVSLPLTADDLDRLAVVVEEFLVSRKSLYA